MKGLYLVHQYRLVRIKMALLLKLPKGSTFISNYNSSKNVSFSSSFAFLAHPFVFHIYSIFFKKLNCFYTIFAYLNKINIKKI